MTFQSINTSLLKKILINIILQYIAVKFFSEAKDLIKYLTILIVLFREALKWLIPYGYFPTFPAAFPGY